MKIRIVISILLAMIVSNTKAQNKDSAIVASVFNQYKNAVQTNDGALAYNLIDSNTVNWYADMLELVKTADSSTVSKLNLNDKLMVLVSRQTINHDSLNKFNTRNFFEYSINKSKGTINSGSAVQLGAIEIDNGIAKAKVQATPQGDSIVMIFRYQDNSWKYDLTSIFDSTSQLLKKMIINIGISENEYALYVLEQISGIKPPNEVWSPIK